MYFEHLETHLEILLGFQDLGDSLTSFDTERVAPKMNLFDILKLFELRDVRLEVGSGLRLDVFSEDRE